MSPNTSPKLTVPAGTISNITQPNTTSKNVYSQLKKLGSFSSHFPRNSFSSTIRMPNYAPHIIKFHEAPCHIPVIVHTIRRFTTVRGKPFREPPSGK